MVLISQPIETQSRISQTSSHINCKNSGGGIVLNASSQIQIKKSRNFSVRFIPDTVLSIRRTPCRQR